MRIYKYFFYLIISCTILYQCDSDSNTQNTDENIELNENIVVYNKNSFFDGYTLVSPTTSTSTYLINMEGFIVKKWSSNNFPLSVYLKEDGTLVRTYKIDNENFQIGGRTGGIEMFDFDGNLIWNWQYSTDDYSLHHDICILPNGNILASVWDRKSSDDALNNGRNPDLLLSNAVIIERIIEVKPIGQNDAQIVWEWSSWNHLVQDFDNEKSNFGTISENPDRININYTTGDANLSHVNSIFYIETYDQIVISSRRFNELMIIDHSTTTNEATTELGGNYNKGGRLLYRWGNPAAYNSGNQEDQKLFGQHDVTYLDDDQISNGGNFLVFNNVRFDGGSSVDEILIPQNNDGSYDLQPNMINLPLDYAWSYVNPIVYAPRVSGANRLSNGNTLITIGTEGDIVEIDQNESIVWRYIIPLEVNNVFKCSRYPKNYPIFENQQLPVLDITME